LDPLRAELTQQGIVLAVARAKGWFRVLLEHTGIDDRIRAEHLLPTVRAGAQRFLAAGQAAEVALVSCSRLVTSDEEAI
jgi:hypothetical protein